MSGPCRKYGCKNDRGFTIMEILVAVMILGTAYLVILQNFSMSMRNIEKVRYTQQSSLLAEIEMEKIFKSENPDEEEEKVDGEIYVEGSKYQVVIVADEEKPDLITMKVERK